MVAEFALICGIHLQNANSATQPMFRQVLRFIYLLALSAAICYVISIYNLRHV